MNTFVISILLLILSTSILIVIAAALVFTFRSYGWRKTQGIILRTSLAGESGGIGLSFARVYAAKVKYVYTVEGKKYSGNSISAFEVYDTAGFIAKRIIEKYPRGKVVDVYYSPSDPRISCLKRGIKNPITMVMLTTALFFAVVLFVAGYNMMKT